MSSTRAITPDPPRTADEAATAADAMVRFPKTHRPEMSHGEVESLFEDDHVLMALIVGPDHRLITTIERGDLLAGLEGRPAIELGTLVGRTVAPSEPLSDLTMRLHREQRRRLAVIDDGGRLLGLLCLKRDETGYCSDEGVAARAAERQSQGTGSTAAR